MKRDTDLAWERWGQQDPYFAVLTDQKYRKVNIEDAKEVFFDSGEHHVANVIAELERHFGPISRASALDFGCGVGRLLVPLSKQFSSVVGLDVSRAMLHEASRNLGDRGISNVDLLESDDALSRLEGRTFDFVHTFIVLQHIPRERGYVIIRNLLHRLSAGGAFFVHVCCRRKLTLTREFVYICKTQIPYAYILFNVLQGKRLLEPIMEGNEYDVAKVLEIFQEVGVMNVMTTLEVREHCLTVGFYARKLS